MVAKTELTSERHRGLDAWPVQDVVRALWDGQMGAVASCLPSLDSLSRAVEAAVQRLETGNGRLVYSGAGSAGMIAALDALDLGTTFSWPDDRTLVFMAGGLDLTKGIGSQNEDNANLGIEQIASANVGRDDVVIGVSASGASASTIGTLEEGRRRGALTLAVTSNAASTLAQVAEYTVFTETGAEVIAGSTRLGAGTAQKIVLNLFSTAVMVRLGYVYDNLMIHVRPENTKLRNRCIAIVADIARVSETAAADALTHQGSVERAVLHLAGAADADISTLLERCGGNLRKALARIDTKTAR